LPVQHHETRVKRADLGARLGETGRLGGEVAGGMRHAFDQPGARFGAVVDDEDPVIGHAISMPCLRNSGPSMIADFMPGDE
jgi:hypothetical protein